MQTGTLGKIITISVLIDLVRGGLLTNVGRSAMNTARSILARTSACCLENFRHNGKVDAEIMPPSRPMTSG